MSQLNRFMTDSSVHIERTLITAALPYANGPLHLGHIAGAYLPSDMYARFLRLNGEKVLFICGSDEHGVAITISAEKEGVTPQQIVDRYHHMNELTFQKMGISFDYYGRTSSKLHIETAQQFFIQLLNAGFLLEREEPQLYDEKAGMFLPDRYVEGICPVCSNPDARGDQCERCGAYLDQTELINPRSKVTGSKPVIRPTTHWFFALSAFQKLLEDYLQLHRSDWRDNVVNATRGWLKTGLHDRSITRDLEWGVPVPLEGAKGKALYVWFDAPIGYITATREALDPGINPRPTFTEGCEKDWRCWWQNDTTRWLCYLGKDNIVFHSIVFPAMLMAHNAGEGSEKFVLPQNVVANEFMNLEGQKFSKSRGWTIEPVDVVERYPADLIRYALAVTFPEAKDADFSWKDFQAHVNNELADILGNFVNRVLTFVDRNFENKVPAASSAELSDDPLLQQFASKAASIARLYNQQMLREAAFETMDMARRANKYFNDAEPWRVIKSDRTAAAKTMRACLEAMRALAVYFSPIIPSSAKAIFAMLNYDGSGEEWQTANKAKLTEGNDLGEAAILFRKIEDEQVEEELKRLGSMKTERAELAASTAEVLAIKPPITIDDFKKIDLRTATIIAAEPIPKSKKLLKLRVMTVGGERQIIAGVAGKYRGEELVGKQIVIVANLAPAKLMGEESEGMLLAVNDGGGIVGLITAPNAEPGLEVR